MANKRANPFVDDIITQSKIHVGLKQFNNNEDRLRTVYEKTLELLFRGAKKTPTPSCNLSTEESEADKVDHFKQLFIGNDGALSHEGMIVVCDGKQKECKCGDLRTEPCAYCESPLCQQCRLKCVRCCSSFCSKCILAWSEKEEVCVSCS